MSKIPCALLVNDLHIGKDNISEFRANWEEAVELANNLSIDRIFVGGDLWQSRSAQTCATLLAVRDAILLATKKYNLIVVIASGNHDLVNQEEEEGYNHIFSDYEAVELVDEYAEYDFSDTLSLWVMSYFPENGSFMDRFKALKAEVNRSKNNVLYIHEGIRGGLSVPSEDELPAHIFEDFDSVLVGHYHDRKQIPGTNIQYIGASRQHNFGEDEDKGYTVLYDDGTTEFIKNEVNQRFIVLEKDYDGISDNAVDKEVGLLRKDQRYKIKLRINCTPAQASTVDKSKLAGLGINKIEMVTDHDEMVESDHSSITKKFDKNGIKEEYANYCSQKSIDSQLGLVYLDKLN